MVRKLFFAFIVYGIVELAIYLWISQWVGVLPTVGLFALTSIVGVILLRTVGVKTVSAIQTSVNKGEVPAMAMVEGLTQFIGGILLILPGVLTDLVGIVLVLPFTRNLFKPVVYRWLRKRTKNHQMIIVQK